MKCPACGVETATGAAFCHKCGKSLAAASEPKSPFAQPTADEPREPQRVGVAGEFSPVIWEGSYSWKAMIGSWMLAGLITVVLLVIAFFVQGYVADHRLWVWLGAGGIALAYWIYLLIVFGYRTLSISYRLTEDLLVHQRGILFLTMDRVEVIDIDDLSIEQGLVDRVFDVGTIRVSSSDTSDPVLDMIGIDRVQEVFQKIDNAQRRKRSKIVHVEGV